MSEILTCIKLIKLYAWEKPFAKTIGSKKYTSLFLAKITTDIDFHNTEDQSILHFVWS